MNPPQQLNALPRVTPRAVMDFSRKCSLRCKFCYYLPDDNFYSEDTLAEAALGVRAARSRGCTACDITGGEPLQYRHIVPLVRLCVEAGVKPRIISSLIASDKLIDKLMDAGLDDWLISTHGATAETHNAIVSRPSNAREKQIERLTRISYRMRFCLNYVVVAENQHEVADFARWACATFARLPRIVNFINFNPHYGWRDIEPGKMANVADLRIVSPLLDDAIDYLEKNGVGVNVRYFPYCALKMEHWKNICNDLHVAFDSGEWDNGIQNRTPEGAYEYGLALSANNEEKGEPCNRCGLQWICGGANKVWHAASQEQYGEQLVPISYDGPQDFYRYRQDNPQGMA